MSRSKKWRLEWAFFLGEAGRRKYHPFCRRCLHNCKQSFRVKQLACPRYLSRRSDLVPESDDKNKIIE